MTSRPRNNVELVKVYLEYLRRDIAKDRSASELDWAYDAVCDVVEFSSNTSDAFDLVIALVEMSPDDLLRSIAAGPLENLVCVHGPTIIDRLLVEAEENPKLRRALRGVWGRDAMESHVAEMLDDALRRWNQ